MDAMKGYNTSTYSLSKLVSLSREYKKLGCDTIRHQLVDMYPKAARSTWLEWFKAEVDKICSAASQVPELKYIVDLHHPYGLVDYSTDTHYILTQDGTDYWLEDLAYIISKIKGIKNIIGLEVVNEPWAHPSVWKAYIKDKFQFLRIQAQDAGIVLYISSAYGVPTYLERLPRMGGKLLQPTAHIWPAYSLRFEGQARPRDYKIIDSYRMYKELDTVLKYQKDTGIRVLVGELGCLKFIGQEYQRKYIKKALKYAVAKKLDIFLHGEHGNPVYEYEKNGIWQIVAEAYR